MLYFIYPFVCQSTFEHVQESEKPDWALNSCPYDDYSVAYPTGLRDLKLQHFFRGQIITKQND